MHPRFFMAIKRKPQFDSGEFFRKIGAQKTTREYRNKQSIFSQGDAANALFYIKTGNVKLTVISKRGKKAVVGMFRAGDFFGEGCLSPSSLASTRPFRRSLRLAQKNSGNCDGLRPH